MAAEAAERVADLGPGTLERVLANEGLDELRAALAGLSPQQRDALILRALGLQTAEILELTGWSERQLRRNVERGKRRLGERLDR